ncbi:hypothetical protein LQ327_20860 [Actinomycetospora endophytica]|uniref:DUF7144 domain-containing protein n=1 Tax=Actinomycetospora endophytica TaxID=2291215 RepID=A0ABS8PC35_9PSEU|nr:hypothetical protein [Actinomycetospora endophytica]MCD2195827.1 hypothetical protein [Actinomycetospora endophytica]
MTEPSTEPRGDTTARTRPPSTPTPSTTSTGMSGWVRFAGVVMVVVGVFGVIEGLFALLTPTYYLTGNGVVVAVGLGTWAWVHLVVGAVVALTGAGLLSGDQPWARAVGMVIVGLSILVQLVWLPAAPLWSILVIALDVTILVALAGATSGDRQRA